MAIKLRIIVPIIDTSLLAGVQEEAQAWCTVGTQVDVVQIERGPQSIENSYDEALSVPGILELVQQAKDDGIDGIFVSCFAEPGVHAAREIFDGPVFGGFEPAIHAALGTADKIGILTVLPDVLSMLHRLIGAYGLSKRVTDIRVVDMPVLSVGQHDLLVDRLEAQARTALDSGAAQSFVLGCTGMLDVAHAVSARLSADYGQIPVMDPTGSAITALEQAVRLKAVPSRATYYPPRTKERV
ncbi:aspartate/glutamate racemase family protein [Sediminivirga luteola]|uniref:aspartate/glutamate racemase family protein n=1 Tax=Sediminivirga luteola TaxID=1774748 RepID=UPI001F5605A8|nr:aspartate/glutamate racemase family protein [Sediminivirga luteola]MCI2265102.1 aspartate/glutamate racemase family protein [Sediminivirga luteola]